MPGRKILIVEDEFLIRLTLAEALADEGFDVIETGASDEALTKLQAGNGIDLLLTDIQIPGGLDGMELAHRARERHPDLPVIFVTGRPDSMAGAGRGPRDAIISKPYLPSEVAAAARRLLGD
ncbi:protein of unknown function [Rhodovastum atsumiense]|nr:response regulator [Rhodovastum atsumiense]CAH2599248.1 protein of unknown function [Rhodovastum atsumiense]